MIAGGVGKGEYDRQRKLARIFRQVLLVQNDGRLIGLDAPGDRLSRNRPERVRSKGLRSFRLLFCKLRHLSDRDNDFRERGLPYLLSGYFLSYGEAERVDEREKPFVIMRDQITGNPGNWDRRVFQFAAWRGGRRRQ